MIHELASVPASFAALRLPEVERHRLSNGLEIWVCRQAATPLVSLQMVSLAGARWEEPGCAGLAALTASLLRAGTRSRTAEELAASSEAIGADLLVGTDWDSSVLMIDLLAEDLPLGLELLAEVAWEPSFPPTACARSQRSRIQTLRQRRLHPQPSPLADDHFVQQVYEGLPYGRSRLGDETSLGRVERLDVVRFHGTHFLPAGSHLLVVGALDGEEVLAGLDAHRRDCTKGALPEPLRADPTTREARILLLDVPVAQAELRIGRLAVGRTHPDFPALGVLLIVLGGTSSSRLPANLRECHAWAYGVRARLEGQSEVGSWVVETAVASGNVAAAVGEILRELERLRQEPVPALELERALAYVAGTFPQSFETHYDLLWWLKGLAIDELPADHASRTLERLASLGPTQLLDLAQRSLALDGLVVIVVGRAAELADSLSSFGLPITVIPAGSAAASSLGEGPAITADRLWPSI